MISKLSAKIRSIRVIRVPMAFDIASSAVLHF